VLQVLHCTEQLVKSYCLKKKACTAHMQAPAVKLSADDPTQYRFCQQCGKFECLSKFGEFGIYSAPWVSRDTVFRYPKMSSCIERANDHPHKQFYKQLCSFAQTPGCCSPSSVLQLLTGCCLDAVLLLLLPTDATTSQI
jgi:hypothetical protein